MPVEGVYGSIIRDGDKKVNIDLSDNKGILNFKLYRYREDDPFLKLLDSLGSYPEELWNDTTAYYELEIEAQGFKPYKAPLKLFDGKDETVLIYPDKSYKEKNPLLIYLGCSYTGFGIYHPKRATTLMDIPADISNKLVNHLVDRLGADYYSRIKLTDGQIVDLNRLYTVERNAKNYKWKPYSYYLCFSFKDEAKGIGLYTAQIVLDNIDNIVKEIKLPDIKSNPQKANLLPLDNIRQIAKKNGFDDRLEHIELGYDEDVGSIAWYFKKITDDNGLSFEMKTMSIDAHNGKLLKMETNYGIR